MPVPVGVGPGQVAAAKYQACKPDDARLSHREITESQDTAPRRDVESSRRTAMPKPLYYCKYLLFIVYLPIFRLFLRELGGIVHAQA